MPKFYVCAGEIVDNYLQGMHDRGMQSEMELAQEIQPTDWSTANKPV